MQWILNWCLCNILALTSARRLQRYKAFLCAIEEVKWEFLGALELDLLLWNDKKLKKLIVFMLEGETGCNFKEY